MDETGYIIEDLTVIQLQDELRHSNKRIAALQAVMQDMLWPDGTYTIEELCLVLKNKLSRVKALLAAREEKSDD